MGGRQTRIGCKFHKEMVDIQDQKLRNGTAKDRVALEKISNLMTKNKYWLNLKKDIVDASEEEVEQYGK